jgi:hypothetical protein
MEQVEGANAGDLQQGILIERIKRLARSRLLMHRCD